MLTRLGGRVELGDKAKDVDAARQGSESQPGPEAAPTGHFRPELSRGAFPVGGPALGTQPEAEVLGLVGDVQALPADPSPADRVNSVRQWLPPERVEDGVRNVQGKP